MSDTYAVGQEAGLTIYVHGEVTDRTDDTVTIGGHTLPIRLGGPVRHLSTRPPAEPRTKVVYECDGDCCDGECCDRPHADQVTEEAAALTYLLRAVEDLHADAGHSGPFRFCRERVCEYANDYQGEGR